MRDEWEHVHTDFTMPVQRRAPASLTDSESGWRQYLETAPNGWLIRDNALTEALVSGRPLHLLHTTRGLDVIRAGRQLHVSSGCLIGALYCSPLTAERGGLRPHNLGAYLMETKSDARPLVFEVTPDAPIRPLGVDYLHLGAIHLRIYQRYQNFLTPAETGRLDRIVLAGLRGAAGFLDLALCNASGRPTAAPEFINRTAGPSSGSTILVHDLYGAMPEIHTIFLGRAPVDQRWKAAFDQLITLFTTKRPHGPDFDHYVDELTREVGALIEKTQPNAIHAQHLGFALSLAFTRAADNVPIIAIAHGPDVMAAERSERDRELLHEVVAASASVVAPTAALAGRIDQLTGRRYGDRIAVIPWGIPLGDVRVREYPSTGTGPLSLVYAGRLDANKSAVTGIEAIALTGQPHRLTINRRRVDRLRPDRWGSDQRCSSSLSYKSCLALLHITRTRSSLVSRKSDREGSCLTTARTRVMPSPASMPITPTATRSHKGNR